MADRQYEIRKAMGLVDAHDVPQDRLVPDPDQGLRHSVSRNVGDATPFSAAKDDHRRLFGQHRIGPFNRAIADSLRDLLRKAREYYASSAPEDGPYLRSTAIKKRRTPGAYFTVAVATRSHTPSQLWYGTQKRAWM